MNRLLPLFSLSVIGCLLAPVLSFAEADNVCRQELSSVLFDGFACSEDAIGSELFAAVIAGGVQEVAGLLESNEDLDVSSLKLAGEAACWQYAPALQVDICNASYSSCHYCGTPLFNVAVSLGNIDIARLLLDRGANIDGLGMGPTVSGFGPITSLSYAAHNNDLKMAEFLLEHGASTEVCELDLASELDTPLLQAVGQGNIEMVELLLNYSANTELTRPDYTSRMGYSTPVYLALKRGDLAIARMLLDRGANIENVLRLSAGNNDIDSMAFCLDYGVDVAGVNARGSIKEGSPLREAIYYGNLDATRWLMVQGFSVNHKADAVIALALGNPVTRSEPELLEFVNYLLEQDADVNALDHSCSSPLFRAVMYDYVDIARLLLERGADASGVYEPYSHPCKKSASTLLHYAARWGCYEMAELLLEYGARPDVTDEEGSTPLDCACKLGCEHQEIVELLRRDYPFLGGSVQRRFLSYLHTVACAFTS